MDDMVPQDHLLRLIDAPLTMPCRPLVTEMNGY